MRIFNYIVCILSLFLLSSKCNDKPILNKETKILRGRLMYDCNTPAANEPVRFKASPAFIETIDGEIEVYTDENGYFEFIHNSAGSWYQLWAPYKTLDHIPSKPELDLGEIILYGTVNYSIRLNVVNPKTEFDTLVYSNLNTLESIKLPGPFQSGIIDTFLNVPFMSYPIHFNEIPMRRFVYGMSPLHINFQEVFVSTPFCSEQINEVVFKIE